MKLERGRGSRCTQGFGGNSEEFGFNSKWSGQLLEDFLTESGYAAEIIVNHSVF